jgi:hypothetical protein
MLRRLTLVAALVGAIAIFLAYEHSRIIRAGYTISELSRDEAKLVEQIRIHQVQVTRLRQPEFIKHQVERLRIDLMRAPEGEIVPVATSPADAAE